MSILDTAEIVAAVMEAVEQSASFQWVSHQMRLERHSSGPGKRPAYLDEDERAERVVPSLTRTERAEIGAYAARHGLTFADARAELGL